LTGPGLKEGLKKPEEAQIEFVKPGDESPSQQPK
jgi:hypothetical protein